MRSPVVATRVVNVIEDSSITETVDDNDTTSREHVLGIIGEFNRNNRYC